MAELTDAERQEYRQSLKERGLTGVAINAHYSGLDIFDTVAGFKERVDAGEFDPDSEIVAEARKRGLVGTIANGLFTGTDKDLIMSNLSGEETRKLDEDLAEQAAIRAATKEAYEQRKGEREADKKREREADKKRERKVGAKRKKREKEEVSVTPETLIKEAIVAERSKEEIFDAKLELVGLTREEAWNIIDTLMLQNKPYKKVYKIAGKFSVEFRTRDGFDIEESNDRLDKSLESKGLTGITFSYLTWRQNLAASICRYGDRSFEDDTLEERFEWVRSLQEPVYTMLVQKLQDMYNITNVVFSKDFMQNF